jgi:hypothetical protein
MFDRYVVTPIIALGLAFLIWVYLRSRDQVGETYSLPVVISIDPQQADRYVFETKPDGRKVRVRFYGLPARLRDVKTRADDGQLVLRKTVRVPTDVDQRQDSDYLETLQLDLDSLSGSLPLGVHAEITPSEGRVPVTLIRITEKQLDLKHSVTITAARFELDGPISIQPPTVKVKGPKRVLDQVTQIVLDPWQPTPPPGFDSMIENAIEVGGPQRIPNKIGREGTKVEITPESADLRVKIKPALRVYELTDVPVHFLCPANFPYRPLFGTERHGSLQKLRVRGPANKTPDVRAYVDLTTKQNLKHGLYPDEPIVFDLAPGFFLAEPPPRLSAIKLELIEAGPAKPPEGNSP